MAASVRHVRARLNHCAARRHTAVHSKRHGLTGASPTAFELSVLIPRRSVAVFWSAALMSDTAMPANERHSLRYEAGRAMQADTRSISCTAHDAGSARALLSHTYAEDAQVCCLAVWRFHNPAHRRLQCCCVSKQASHSLLLSTAGCRWLSSSVPSSWRQSS